MRHNSQASQSMWLDIFTDEVSVVNNMGFLAHSYTQGSTEIRH